MDPTSFHPDDALAVAISLVFVLALIEASLSDLCHFQIPNHVPLILTAGFLPIAWLEHFELRDWLDHAAIAVAVFAVSFALFMARIWGGGDAKLVPAVSLWIGSQGLSRFLLVMAFLGCGLSLAALLARRLPSAAIGRFAPWHARLLATRQVPYGLAIAGAGLDWWVRAVMS
jgi:prepilin peptidase CpaA